MHRIRQSFDSGFLATFVGRCILGSCICSAIGGTALWIVMQLTLGGYVHAVETVGHGLKGVETRMGDLQEEMSGIRTEVSEFRTDFSNGDVPSMNLQIEAIKSDIKAQFADMKSDMDQLIDQQVFEALDDFKAGQEQFFEEIRGQQVIEP